VSKPDRANGGPLHQEACACKPLLSALALRLCGNRADAEDLVQDVYERALNRLDRAQPDTNVRAWMATILHNLFVDRCRAAQRRPRLVPLPDALSAEEREPPPAWAALPPDEIRAAIDALPDEFRAVYALHARGRSYDQIAGELGIPTATVGTRLLRARRKLKAALAARCEALRTEEMAR
jgi:RNA polymerase sigma-70 factor (ECF subfamily)